MATRAALLAEIATAVETTLASSFVRMSSDYATNTDKLAAGGDLYQLRGGPAGIELDSNETYALEQLELVLVHQLGPAESERAWTEGDMQLSVGDLTVPGWWLALASVHEVRSDIRYEIERDYRAIVVTLTLELALVP